MKVWISKLNIKSPERLHWSHSGIFIVNFEHISHLFLVLQLLALNKYMLAGNYSIGTVLIFDSYVLVKY